MGMGGNNTPLVFEPGLASREGNHIYEEKAPTLRAHPGDNLPAVAFCIAGNTIDRQVQNGSNGKGVLAEKSYTINATDRHAVAFPSQSYTEYNDSEKSATLKACGGMHGGGSESLVVSKTVGALCEADHKGANNQYVEQGKCVIQKYVRRLTPRECERLQGLPDDFTLIADKSCSDSARYKALGNGMAQPCADWILRRIVEESAV